MFKKIIFLTLLSFFGVPPSTAIPPPWMWEIIQQGGIPDINDSPYHENNYAETPLDYADYESNENGTDATTKYTEIGTTAEMTTEFPAEETTNYDMYMPESTTGYGEYEWTESATTEFPPKQTTEHDIYIPETTEYAEFETTESATTEFPSKQTTLHIDYFWGIRGFETTDSTTTEYPTEATTIDEETTTYDEYDMNFACISDEDCELDQKCCLERNQCCDVIEYYSEMFLVIARRKLDHAKIE